MRTLALSLGLMLAPGLSPVPLAAARARAAAHPARSAPASAHLVGIALASGQALIWDGAARRFLLLGPGDRFRGARVLDLGFDRVLVEQGGQKRIWKLGAPMLLHPARATARLARRPGLIVTPEAPPPVNRTRPRPRRGAGDLPPAPIAQDEPLQIVSRRARLGYRVLTWLAADLVRARQELRLELVRSGALQVRWVRPAGRLAPLGLRPGDQILLVQGRQMRRVEDAAEVFASLRPRAVLRLQVRRGHRLLRLRVVLP